MMLPSAVEVVQGDPNAVFIIRSATTITTAGTSQVVLTKGAKAANVFFTAGTAVTLGTNSIMKGTLLAGTAISLLTGANLEGRALNQGAAAEAVTVDSCTMKLPLQAKRLLGTVSRQSLWCVPVSRLFLLPSAPENWRRQSTGICRRILCCMGTTSLAKT